MNHEELRVRIQSIVQDPSTAGYLLHWAADGRAVPTFISLIPQKDGTVTATQGDMRERIIPVLDESGRARLFSDEASACEWAWDEIKVARHPAPTHTPEQQARFLANGEAKRRLLDELDAQRKAQDDSTNSG